MRPFLITIFTIFTLLSALPSAAQNRRLLIPQSPKTATDLAARAVANVASAIQPVAALNVSTGIRGIEEIARSPADGTAVGILTAAGARSYQLEYKRPPPVEVVANMGPAIMAVVVPSSARGDLRESIRTLSLAHAGLASSSHACIDAIRLHYGIEGEVQPYKGTAPLIMDVMSGGLQMACLGLAHVANLARQGRLRIVAVTGSTRANGFPEVPTVGELGIQGSDTWSWEAVVSPLGLSSDTKLQLTAAFSIAIEGAQPQLSRLGYESMSTTTAAEVSRIHSLIQSLPDQPGTGQPAPSRSGEAAAPQFGGIRRFRR